MVNAAKLLAWEVATSGVTINTVTFGRIESYQIDRSRNADQDTLATAMAATISRIRIGRTRVGGGGCDAWIRIRRRCHTCNGCSRRG